MATEADARKDQMNQGLSTTDQQAPEAEPASKSGGWLLLRTRDFGLLFCGQLTSQIGDSLSKVALLWFVYQMTGSALKMAINCGIWCASTMGSMAPFARRTVRSPWVVHWRTSTVNRNFSGYT